MAIARDNFAYKNVTIQSEKFIVVTEPEKKKIAIVNCATKRVKRLQNNGNIDQAIMNPDADMVALRQYDGTKGSTSLNVYSFQVKSTLKSSTIAAEVKYWKWISEKEIAIVTPDSVYHWSFDGQGAPVKMFDRSREEASSHWSGQVHINNYQQSKDKKWLMLGGVAKGKQGGIVGVLQVYSVDMKASQHTMPSHAACFATAQLEGRDSPSTIICFTMTGPGGPALQLVEVGQPAGTTAWKKQVRLRFGGADDFPTSILADDDNGIVFILTRSGVLITVEVSCGKAFFKHQTKPMIGYALNKADGGIVTVEKGTGKVLKFFLEKKNVVRFICDTMKDLEFGLKMATRYNLPGADHLFQKQFNAFLNQRRFQEAVELTANSPQGVLRTMETMQCFKQLPPIAGQPATSYYFNLLLKKAGASLNQVESIELVKSLLEKCSQQPEKSEQVLKLVNDWLVQKKITSSKDLGDALKRFGDGGLKLALRVYSLAKIPDRVIACFLALSTREQDGAKAKKIYEEIIKYAAANEDSYTPQWTKLVEQLWNVNPARAQDFGMVLIAQEEEKGKQIVNVQALADSFQRNGDIKGATCVLLEYLRPRGDRKEDAALQTKVLLINLNSNPRIANAILDSQDYSFTNFDKLKVAVQCERAELFDRALEYYTEMSDYKRVLGHSPNMKIEDLQAFFGRLTPEEAIECLTEMLKNGVRQNLAKVVEIAKKWSEQFTPKALIEMFEEFSCYEGIYLYTASFVTQSKDSKVVYKCIEACVKVADRIPNALKFVISIVRQHEYFDAKEVKDLLIDANLKKDPRPLIYLCNKYNYVDELTEYLWKNGLFKYVEVFVQRMSPDKTPIVVGTLLHLNAPEEKIKEILQSMRPPSEDVKFVANLVAECEKVNRLVILKPWLEAQAGDGSEDPEIYNGLAKIYVDTNTGKRAEKFLMENNSYNPAIVGKYCESRDPQLAVVAYKRAEGKCDDQLIKVTNENGFFREQAQYLVKQEKLDLWAKVLDEKNQYRRDLIDQVVNMALPSAEKPSQVAATVRAFMAANLQSELIELLERLILHDTGGRDLEQFRTSKNLQNLLILTAIKADKKRVMDYIQRLDNYEGPKIAKIASHPEHKLYDEAFFIYKKFKMGVEAIQVVIQKMEDLEKASDFASTWDKPDVWLILGKAQLDGDKTKEAIASFLKADDPLYFEEVIGKAKQDDLFDPLIDFVLMARSKVKNPLLDNELIYAYARTEKLAELEEFLNQKNHAKYPEIGLQLFEQKMYVAAKIIYKHIKDNAQLALCYVFLKEYKNAVDAAEDANKDPVWKEVCFACVDAKKFKLAQRCAMNIIVKTNGLDQLCTRYELRGYFEELISVLEAGIQLERAHQGIFTQLGICYCKYKEEKLMQHIKDNKDRFNIPRLLQACRQSYKWLEVVYLYNFYAQHDNAVDTLMTHSAECWSHDLFKATLHKASNTEIFYRAIEFYMKEKPMMLNDLCADLAPKLDHQRVVMLVRRQENLPLIKEYLLSVQNIDNQIVNDAVNGLFLEEEDYKALLKSVDTYGTFDQLSWAIKLKKHQLLEFRRISAHLYRKNKKYADSLELSKKDCLWDDAMVTAEASGDQKIAEGLLYFFVEQKQYECFAACLYTCYELIRPDVVLELAWRNNLTDFAMPYMVQTFSDVTAKMSQLFLKVKTLEERLNEEKKKGDEGDQQGSAGYSAPLMITAGPAMGMAPPGMGMPPGGPMGMAPGGPMGMAPGGPMGMAPGGPMGMAPPGPMGMQPQGQNGGAAAFFDN